MKDRTFPDTRTFFNSILKIFKKDASKIKPFTDIFETRDDLVVRVDLPGVKEEDIQVRLNPTTLEICAKIDKYKVTKTDSFHTKERRQSQYYRCGNLPIPVDPNTVRVKYGSGVLEIRARKAKDKKLFKIKRKKAVKKKVVSTEKLAE